MCEKTRRANHRSCRGAAWASLDDDGGGGARRTARHPLASLLLAGLLLAASAAQAAVTVNKTFSPSSMTVNGTSTITITLGNTGASAATAAAFTDSLPGGLVVASPSNVATTCAGTATAAAGGGSVALSGGTIPPGGGTCTVTATVTSSALGNYTNTIPAGAVTSSQGSNGAAASATLAVLAPQSITANWAGAWPPTFGGRLKGNGAPESITLTLNNVNTIALTNVTVPLTLYQPVLTFATPANQSTTCGGTLALTASGLTLSGGTIPASGNCNIKFDIIAAQPNVTFFGNAPIQVAAASITDSQGITNTNAFTSSIPVQTGSSINKAFLPTSVVSGGTSTVTLTINNFNYSSLSPITLTDPLPSNTFGTMTVAPVPNASTTCGGTLTAAPGAGSVQLSGGALPSVAPNASTGVSCTVTFDVVATDLRTTAVNLTNLIPAGNFGGVGYPAASAILNVLPNQPLFGSSKVVSNYNYAGNELTFAGTTHSVTIKLNNTTTLPITVTSVTDDLATMGPGFVVAADTPPSTTCVGGTVTATPGSTIISMTGGTIPASDGTTPGSCTLTAGLYIPLTPAALGGHTNTIPAGGIVTSAGSNTTPIVFGISVYTPLQLAKAFSPASVNPGGTSTLTLTIARRGAAGGEINGDPLTGISASDTLPAGMIIATPSGLTHTCNAGATVTAASGGSTIAFSGVDLAYATNCTVSVNVTVPLGTPPGTLTNLIPANTATTNQGVTNSTIPVGGGSYGNGQAAANLTVTSAYVTINKTFTPASVPVGTTSQLAINVINTNPGNIQLTQAALADALPIGMTVATPPGATFTGAGCAGTVSATAGATSVGVSNATVNAGSTCTLKVNVVGTAAGNLINTIPAGALASVQGVSNSAPATATLQATGTADLAITKTDGATNVATGTTTTYTVVVSNTGPNNVIGATVADTPPAGMTFTGWTCSVQAGASCGAASGTGPINDTININVGTTVTYTVSAQVASNFAGASITNTASVAPPGIVTDPTQGNNSASDTDTVVAGVVLALTKTDGSATYTPGGTATYTITVGNTGAANATQVNVGDTLPAGVTLAGNVTCTPAGTATCGTVNGGAGQAGFGASNATIAGGAGNTLTFTVPVTFASSLTTSPLVNTVSATDVPSGATGSASDSDTLDASANVSIVKTGTSSVVPGGPISYTLTIANAGPSAANGATFNDPLPASITGVSASCGSAGGGAVCPGSVTVAGGTVSGTIPTLPAGGSVVITIGGTTSPATNAPLSNTATVAPAAGTTDPVPANNTSTATTSIKPVVDIDKTVDATTVIPGDTITYTVTVTNTGTVDATNTLVTDAMPNGITSWAWTCAASGGATCPNAAGTGNLNETIAVLPAGGSVVYTMLATVSPTPPTNINNIATATPPNGACAPANTPAPCSATASLPPVPQIGVSKTADATSVTPAGTIHYTIVVANNGVLAADGTPVDDPLPAGIASQSWTCTASGGATCTSASGAGAISDTIATFPAGSFVTYTVAAIVDANPPAIVSNTVTVTPLDADAVCTPGNTPGPCTATANVTSNAQISISKTADTAMLTPGGTVTYTVIVTNTGAAPADGTTVDDPLPAGIAAQAWTCAANAGATCTATGSGAISDTLATFPPGSFVTYTIVATIADDPPATITNIATANPPPGSLCTPGNTPAPCDAQVSGGAVPQVSVTKTSDASGPLTPGGTVTYTVTATNSGSADAAGTLLADPLPAGIDAATWTCAASGGAACPNAAGSGAINETIATFPSGGSVVYTIVATVSATPPASVNNTASVMPPSGVCLPGNTAPPCVATVGNATAPQVSVTKTADDPSYVAGGTLSWTVTVTNTGSTNADGTQVSDLLPVGIVSSAWTCVPGAGAVCANTTGTGAINETITTLPPGVAVAYMVTGTVATPAPTSITNTATATPPAGGTCGAPANDPPPCAATVTTASAASVAITKSVADASGNGIAEPGEALTYTITLANPGGSDATAFGITDPLDPNTTFVSADNGGTFAGGTVTWSNLTVPAGGNLVLHLVATVDAPLAASVTQIANVAYETGTTPPACPPAGPQCAVLPTPGSVTLVKSVIDANTDRIAEPGEALSYTILLTNPGGSDVAGYAVSDVLDANTTFLSADNGGTEAGGVVAWSDLTIPAGGSLALSVVATVADPLPAGVDTIANVAYETGTTAPACPPAGPQCAVLPVPGAVTIAKTVVDGSGNGLAEPGETLTYTITLTNTGTADRIDYSVVDPLDANLVFVAADNGGALAGGVVTWSGLVVPAGGNLVLSVVATVADPLPAGVTQIANVAYEAGATPPNCSVAPLPANCSMIPVPTPGAITIAKSVQDGTHGGSAEPGEPLTYTITLSNSGGSAVTGFGVTDPLDPNVVFASANNGGAYAGGVVTWSNLTIPANGSVSLILVVTAADPMPNGVTSIVNVAYETGTSPADCGLVPLPASCAVIPVTPPSGTSMLSIQKSVNTATTTPGGTVVYTVVVSNVGSVDATNATVGDPIPSGIASYAWTCAATGGATCPNANGSGAIAETIATLPVGGAVTYTITAVLSATPPASVTNVANAASTGTSVCVPAGSAPPCTSQAVVAVIPGSGVEVIPTPVDSRWMLLLMMVVLSVAAARGRRKT